MMGIEELVNQMNLGNVAPCPRCGELCKLNPSGNDKARLLKRADTVKDGLCVNCAVQSFIMSVETLAYGIEKNGPQVLLNPIVQTAYADLMVAGNADAQPAEIRWEKVVENWHLPMPGKKGGRR